MRYLSKRLLFKSKLFICFLFLINFINAQNTFSKSNSVFAKDFVQINFEQGKNFCFSPLLISCMLGWLQNGASGETLNELRAVSHISNESIFIDDFSLLMSRQLDADYLQLSNAIWLKNEQYVMKDFLDISKRIEAHIQEIDFTNSKDATEIINSFIGERTNGIIDSFLPSDFIAPNTEIVLTNALYFKDNWSNPFDKSLSFEGTFTSGINRKHKVQYMKQENIPVHFFGSSNYLGIALPFEEDEFCMIFLKPIIPSISISQIIEKLDFNQLAEKLEVPNYSKMTELVLPRFSQTTKLDLKKALLKMGLRKPFYEAEFDKIFPGISIYGALHETTIEVEEEGAESASSTAVAMNRSSGTEFILDRPFIYAIYNKKEKLFVIVGVYAFPE